MLVICSSEATVGTTGVPGGSQCVGKARKVDWSFVRRNRPARRIVSRGSTRYVAPRSADWLSPKLFRSEVSAYTSPVME